MADQDSTPDAIMAALLASEVRSLLARRGVRARVELLAADGQSLSEPARGQLLVELSQAQDKLDHMERLAATGRLAAGVVHEARNLLTGTLGFAQVLLSKAQEPAAVQDMARMIESEARRCVDILAGFLKLSRGSRESARLLSALAIVGPVARLVAHPLQQRECTLSVALEDDLPGVFGCCGELQRVLINLVLNACDAVGAGGHVLITGMPAADGGLELSVTDDGPGVPAELAERIFEPFFSTKTGGDGTGLGLSLSRSIVEAHGGRLTLDRDAPAGASFTVYLPAARVPTGPLEVVRS
jgi:two-component system, NtrC family, sensor kinase